MLPDLTLTTLISLCFPTENGEIHQ